MQLEELKPAILKCTRLNIPFAVYAYPGEDDYHFISSMPDPNTGENELRSDMAGKPLMDIGFFNHEESYCIAIAGEMSPADIQRIPHSFAPLDEPDIRPVARSTSEILYRAQVHQIKKNLRAKGSKTVLSRIIAGETTRSLDDIVCDYFGSYPSTFRSIFFTQETGLWMGATPELLLDYDLNSGRFVTMSLAGTRHCSDDNWDDKNTEEQDIVTTYILNKLSDLKATDISGTESYNLPYGAIEHRCNLVSGTFNGNPRELIDNLSPTPAVAGFPADKAVYEIYDFETHSRYCYAGNITVLQPDEGHIRSYVNLRCALLRPEGDKIIYNIYTGSGLTRQSDATDEWNETAAKAATLLSIMQQKNGKKEK